jgi:transketolase
MDRGIHDPDSREPLTAGAIRRLVVEQAKRADVGHIGSALSVADILAALYGRVLHIPHPRDPGRDRFVLSKGHAALALYAALYLRGLLAREELEQYGTDGSLLNTHPDHALPGVDFSTGSLGHGLSFAAGVALAARLQRSGRRAFALISDAECNEGSVWEALLFAAHHGLANLIALVDLNGQQAFGYTDDVLSTSPLAERLRAFRWDVHEIDGHDVDEITATIRSLNVAEGPPHALVCRTVFGKGVSFMESQIPWHYLPLDDAQYRQALDEIARASP